MEQNIKTQLLTKKPINLLFQLSVPVYFTMPVGRIVGEFTISNIISGKPNIGD